MTIVLLSTNRLTRSYLETVLNDLGRGRQPTLDVVAWAPPREPLDDLVRRFVLIGPGQLPPAAAAAGPAITPSAPRKPSPGPPLIARAKNSRPARTLRRLRTGPVPRRYWARIRRRDDILALVDDADIVIALDTRSVRAGWHLARRSGHRPVVVGVPAAVRHLVASA